LAVWTKSLNGLRTDPQTMLDLGHQKIPAVVFRKGLRADPIGKNILHLLKSVTKLSEQPYIRRQEIPKKRGIRI